jgi:Kef-type K+ transport system membrane component KefB
MAGGSKTVLNGLFSVNTFTLFLLQIMLIIAIARVLAFLLKRLYQPVVVAEIIGATALAAHAARNDQRWR